MLTTSSYLVLGLVRMLGTTTPYQLKHTAAATVGPFWSLPHTQIYAQCDKLVGLGLLDQVQEDGGRQKRTLSISAAGRAALREWLGDDEFVPVEARDLGILKLFFGADPAVLGPEQLRNHERILARYEKLRDRIDESVGAGPRSALAFGIEYERWMIAFWSERVARTTPE